MYHSTFAHLNNDHQPLVGRCSAAPARRKPRRRSGALPAWRNHVSLLRARTSQQ